MNAEQRKIVTDMNAGALPPVHTISTSDAEALIASGHARGATVDPAPTSGQTAINLTAKGRGVKPTKAAIERAAAATGDTAPTTR